MHWASRCRSEFRRRSQNLLPIRSEICCPDMPEPMDHSPAMLDELSTAGEVLWAGAGPLAGNDGWLSLVPAEAAGELLPPTTPLETSQLHEAILHTLDDGQALFVRAIVERLRTAADA